MKTSGSEHLCKDENQHIFKVVWIHLPNFLAYILLRVTCRPHWSTNLHNSYFNWGFVFSNDVRKVQNDSEFMKIAMAGNIETAQRIKALGVSTKRQSYLLILPFSPFSTVLQNCLHLLWNSWEFLWAFIVMWFSCLQILLSSVDSISLKNTI